MRMRKRKRRNKIKKENENKNKDEFEHLHQSSLISGRDRCTEIRSLTYSLYALFCQPRSILALVSLSCCSLSMTKGFPISPGPSGILGGAPTIAPSAFSPSRPSLLV